ncbi:MAG: hypothetical protein HOQ14_08120, partial [Gemmatimonadaceae bacterium]|nr:hypothetical protein [Gemmatimonadaceae bacterium]
MTDVRIVTEPLGGSPLSRAVQGAAAPARWLAARPRSAEAWRALAQARAAESGWHERWEALRPA